MAANQDQVFAREVKRGQDTFEFTYRVKLPDLRASAKLWMPLARPDGFQKVQLTKMDSPNSRELVDSQHQNKIVFVELEPAHS